MMLTFDTETQGLNAQKFLCASIAHQNGKTESFGRREDCLNRILNIGRSLGKQGKRLYCYAHNLQYDFYALNLHITPGVKVFSRHPFIANYYEGDKHLVQFIDTMGIWRTSLAKIGASIGYEKGITPEWLKLDSYDPSYEEIQEMLKYNQQDCKVLMEALLTLRDKLKTYGLAPRRLLTSSQIGIKYLLKLMKEHNKRNVKSSRDLEYAGIILNSFKPTYGSNTRGSTNEEQRIPHHGVHLLQTAQAATQARKRLGNGREEGKRLLPVRLSLLLLRRVL